MVLVKSSPFWKALRSFLPPFLGVSWCLCTCFLYLLPSWASWFSLVLPLFLVILILPLFLSASLWFINKEFVNDRITVMTKRIVSEHLSCLEILVKCKYKFWQNKELFTCDELSEGHNIVCSMKISDRENSPPNEVSQQSTRHRCTALSTTALWNRDQRWCLSVNSL